MRKNFFITTIAMALMICAPLSFATEHTEADTALLEGQLFHASPEVRHGAAERLGALISLSPEEFYGRDSFWITHGQRSGLMIGYNTNPGQKASTYWTTAAYPAMTSALRALQNQRLGEAERISLTRSIESQLGNPAVVDALICALFGHRLDTSVAVRILSGAVSSPKIREAVIASFEDAASGKFGMPIDMLTNYMQVLAPASGDPRVMKILNRFIQAKVSEISEAAAFAMAGTTQEAAPPAVRRAVSRAMRNSTETRMDAFNAELLSLFFSGRPNSVPQELAARSLWNQVRFPDTARVLLSTLERMTSPLRRAISFESTNDRMNLVLDDLIQNLRWYYTNVSPRFTMTRAEVRALARVIARSNPTRSWNKGWHSSIHAAAVQAAVAIFAHDLSQVTPADLNVLILELAPTFARYQDLLPRYNAGERAHYREAGTSSLTGEEAAFMARMHPLINRLNIFSEVTSNSLGADEGAQIQLINNIETHIHLPGRLRETFFSTDLEAALTALGSIEFPSTALVVKLNELLEKIKKLKAGIRRGSPEIDFIEKSFEANRNHLLKLVERHQSQRMLREMRADSEAPRVRIAEGVNEGGAEQRVRVDTGTTVPSEEEIVECLAASLRGLAVRK